MACEVGPYVRPRVDGGRFRASDWARPSRALAAEHGSTDRRACPAERGIYDATKGLVGPVVEYSARTPKPLRPRIARGPRQVAQ